jgi:choline dehydrogenase
VLQALPGVGRNLHDHLAFGCVWENAGKPSPRVPRSQTSCFWKTDAGLEAPNFKVYSHGGSDFSPENAARFKAPSACWSLSAGMRPNSRGIIHLTGPDPDDPVTIDPNYLNDPQDLKNLSVGLDLAREIGNSSALRPFTGREVAPGSHVRGGVAEFSPRRHWHALASVWHSENGT